jgi:hypothetical protein
VSIKKIDKYAKFIEGKSKYGYHWSLIGKIPNDESRGYDNELGVGTLW